MKQQNARVALARLLDALESDLIAAPPEEIAALAAESGMTLDLLLADMRMRPEFRAILRQQAPEEGATDGRNEIAPSEQQPPNRR